VPIALKNRWSIPPGGGDRSLLVVGVDKPGPDTTGVLPNIARTAIGTKDALVSTNRTYSTPGEVVENVDFYVRVSVTAPNVTFRNCYFHGYRNAPSASFGLIQCTNANVASLNLIDCTIAPDYPHWDWQGILGHSFTMLRCNVFHCQDSAQIQRGGQTWPFDTRVTIQQSWFHDFAWFSAATGGIVHPSDTETHNDHVQNFGGRGTRLIGNYFDARFARQVGHWRTTTPTEPFTTVALGSLGSGFPGFDGPFQHIPDRDLTEGSPSFGTGIINGVPSNEENGRYNWDDCANLMIGDELGATVEMVVTDNWFRGGNYSINGGGNTNPGGGAYLGDFLRNKFTRDQGSQQSGGNTTQTINFQVAGWTAANWDVPTTGADKNYYEDTGAGITVRT
jgi:hypothetical protein